MRIAFYITAHGYGHGVRSCDLLRALWRRFPDARVTVTTDLPESFLRNRLPFDGLAIRPGAFDVGMVQLDSIRVDVDETLHRALAVVADRNRLRSAETRFLRDLKPDLVVADIPSIPLEAAAAAGIPSVAVGNFSWDWIYAPFVGRDARWRQVIGLFEEGYRQAGLLLKLPFSPAMEIFPRQQEIPLLAEPAEPRRAALAAQTGADPARRWMLLSFTTLAWDAAALREVEAMDGVEFFTVKPLAWPGCWNIHAVDRGQMSFAEVLASVDGVITKPGFGILSECVANRKPLIYTEREDFIEYPLLETGLKRVLCNAYIPSAELYAGRLGPALDALEQAPPPPETLPFAGGAAAVDVLLEQAGCS